MEPPGRSSRVPPTGAPTGGPRAASMSVPTWRPVSARKAPQVSSNRLGPFTGQIQTGRSGRVIVMPTGSVLRFTPGLALPSAAIETLLREAMRWALSPRATVYVGARPGATMWTLTIGAITGAEVLGAGAVDLAGVGATAGADPGSRSTWPIRMRSWFLMAFKSMSALTVVPKRLAMTARLSPFRMV